MAHLNSPPCSDEVVLGFCFPSNQQVPFSCFVLQRVLYQLIELHAIRKRLETPTSHLLNHVTEPITLPIMAANSGTMRGTPSRGQGRGQLPAFSNSPAASNIPRPAFETQTSVSAIQSEAGGATMSASRQKQTKRDEVC